MRMKFPPPPPSPLDPRFPDPQRMLTSPLDCSGWPEPRVYVEAQQWFTGPSKDIVTQSKHTHIGACVPSINSSISGVLVLDVLAQLHMMNDHVLDELHAELVLGSSKVPLGEELRVNMDCTAPDQQLYCMRVYRLQLDTTRAIYDGVNSIKIFADLRNTHPQTQRDPALGQGFGSNTAFAFPVTLKNGKPANPTPAGPAATRLMARGTMSFPWSYTEVFWYGALPTQPVSGLWTTPLVQSVQHSKAAEVTGTFASLDPAFHKTAPSEGSVLLRSDKAYRAPFTIDTTKLPNGRHKLFVRTDVLVRAGCSGA